MFSGVLGVPPGAGQKTAKNHSSRNAAIARAASDNLPAADLDHEQQALEKKVAHPIRRDDLLSYLLYPKSF